MKLHEEDIFITTTDTVLGIGGKINNVVKEKIYEMKKRDRKKPLVIVVSSVEQLNKLEKLNYNHLSFIKKYWPGNVTLIINGNAYRMPNNIQLLNLIESDGPFYLTSCNISNKSNIDNLEDAKKVFPNLKYFDFGEGSGLPSIIINTDNGEIIRK
ncbi:MAG: Sua5/YciO/YrdC/YwlC family protein [Mycoplasma sp.]|nr:Sua5/YciO/YrdC/YwlC family protein [Mycoplasma sp.]